MKIMELISGWGVNGAIVTCLQTIRMLLDRGHQITLVCRPNAWIADQFEEGEVDIVYSDMHRWPMDQLKRVAGIVKDQQIDLLHTHMSRANLFGVLLRKIYGCPVVATANNRYIQPHWMFNDRVIAASMATKRFHNRFNLVPNRRIDVVHNFIDYRPFDRDQNAGIALRQQYGFSPDDVVVGQVGDVIARKGLLYLIRALPQILQKCPQTKVLVIGRQDDDYTELSTNEARKLEVEHALAWTGEIEQVQNYLNAIDVFALPTLEDNLPLSILEAMANSLPIVASAVGGIPECVAQNENGLLVKPGKPKPLAEALIRLIESPETRLSMGRRSRERVVREFSQASQGPRLESVFQKVAS